MSAFANDSELPQSQRPRLNLKKRDENAARVLDTQRQSSLKKNPFGDAKPREAVLSSRTGKSEEEILKEQVKGEHVKLRLNPDQLEEKKGAQAAIDEVKQLLEEHPEGESKDALEQELKAREAALDDLMEKFEKLYFEGLQKGEIQPKSMREQRAQQQAALAERGGYGGRGGAYPARDGAYPSRDPRFERVGSYDKAYGGQQQGGGYRDNYPPEQYRDQRGGGRSYDAYADRRGPDEYDSGRGGSRGGYSNGYSGGDRDDSRGYSSYQSQNPERSGGDFGGRRQGFTDYKQPVDDYSGGSRGGGGGSYNSRGGRSGRDYDRDGGSYPRGGYGDKGEPYNEYPGIGPPASGYDPAEFVQDRY